MGSLINAAHLASVDRYVQLAIQEGGEIVTGGHALTEGDFAKGSFYSPTIITGLKIMHRSVKKKFRPVLVDEIRQ